SGMLPWSICVMEGQTAQNQSWRNWKREGKAEGLSFALLRLLEREFSLGDRDRDEVRAVQDTEKLQRALEEVFEPGATLESVLTRLRWSP
ncbi:MAG: hypothetical protein ABR590_11330, partial [Spirochaetia bacterium]